MPSLPAQAPGETGPGAAGADCCVGAAFLMEFVAAMITVLILIAALLLAGGFLVFKVITQRLSNARLKTRLRQAEQMVRHNESIAERMQDALDAQRAKYADLQAALKAFSEKPIGVHLLPEHLAYMAEQIYLGLKRDGNGYRN